MNGTLSCASCHEQSRAYTDGRAIAFGAHGEPGVRSAMSLANVVYMPVLTWANPNLKSLEQQLLVPLFGETPVEMGMSGREEDLFTMLRQDDYYKSAFRAAFPDQDGAISLATLSRALASFERSLLSFNSPYDRFKHGGKPGVLSAAARRGERLFFSEELECSHCHGGLNFSDNIDHVSLAFPETGFHNTGLYNLDGKGAYPADDHGLREVTGDPADEGRMRTPSLRNVAVTAPYMHDGFIASLRGVIRDHYASKGVAVHRGQLPNPLCSELLEGFALRSQDIEDIIAFLGSLTDREFLPEPRLGNPWSQQGVASP